MTCRRCGDVLVMYEVTDRHCLRCKREVRALVEADARRRAFRVFSQSKDLTPRGAA